MEQQLLDIRDQQKASWNKYSSGWKKWDDLTMDFLKPMGDDMIRRILPKGNDYVLDIASGTGEPGLTIATMLDDGKVMITDLSMDMLNVAEEKAARKGITNIETLACDVSQLPFEDNTFDAISCRFGFMFFPDMHIAARDMVRVLKPGGRIATAVWYDPDKNGWITSMMKSISLHMELPVVPQSAPSMFRCGQEGFLIDLFRQVGLMNINEAEVSGILKAGTPDVYWSFMTEVVSPVVGALSRTDPSTIEKIKAEVFQSMKDTFPPNMVMPAANALVVSGEKPRI